MKVTPETLTDEMIGNERARAVNRMDKEMAFLATIAFGSNGREACLDRGYSITPFERDRARQRICDAINARKGGG